MPYYEMAYERTFRFGVWVLADDEATADMAATAYGDDMSGDDLMVAAGDDNDSSVNLHSESEEWPDGAVVIDDGGSILTSPPDDDEEGG